MTASNRHELREIRKTIGDNIRYHRVRQGHTIHGLAKLCHLHPERLDKYEIGKEDMELTKLLKIAEKLNVPMKQFF